MRKSISTLVIILGVGWISSGDEVNDTSSIMGKSVRIAFASGSIMGARLCATGKFKTTIEVRDEALRRYDAYNAGYKTALTNGI